MAIDDYNHQVGAIVAELLGLPCVTAVSHLDIDGAKGVAEREIEGGIEVVENTIHEGVDGRRYLVVHGDIFDLVVTQARWLALLGDKAYEFALTANRIFNAFRRILGAPYWSLSKWAKLKVKNAVNYIGAFEKALATEARHHRAEGVICGHIHTAAMYDDYGLRYVNCGDWVESCTALVEGDDGMISLVDYRSHAANAVIRARIHPTPSNHTSVSV